MVVKNLAANAGDTGSIPGSGRSPGEGNGNPLYSSCLGSPRDRGAWWAIVMGLQRVGHNLVTENNRITFRGNLLPSKSTKDVGDYFYQSVY